jgi:ERF superfamily
MNDSIPNKKVYLAISAVMAALAKSGISKDRVNQDQKYKFRGIDDVYNALAPVLSDAKLVILPRVLRREVAERQSNKGSIFNYVVLEVEFDIVCADDGSSHTVKTYGEAMDFSDKATNKAMSAAYKYMAMQVFCIPTEGDNDNDADATTLEISSVNSDQLATAAIHSLEGRVADAKTALTECKSLDELAGVFGASISFVKGSANVSVELRKKMILEIESVKDRMKAVLSEAAK